MSEQMKTPESTILSRTSTEAVDPLSEVLSLVRARCVMTGGFTAGGHWGMRFRPDSPLKLAAIVQGTCWAAIDEGEPLLLSPGDVLVANGAEVFSLASQPAAMSAHPDPADVFRAAGGTVLDYGGGADVTSVGGHIDLDEVGLALVQAGLPRTLVLREGPSTMPGATLMPGTGSLLRAIHAELTAPAPGTPTAVDNLAQYLLIRLLRASTTVTNAGWLRLLLDDELRPAMRAIHADPAAEQPLAELARLVAMSRSRFAARFRERAGMPPARYRTQWRMHLAKRDLTTTDETIAAIGARLGFGSDSAFSAAFRREVGVAPRRYRADHRPHLAPAAAIA